MTVPTVPPMTSGEDPPVAGDAAAAPAAPPPEIFRQAVDSLTNTSVRAEVRVEPLRPPQRLAPYSYAVSAEIIDADGKDRATGRLVLLHDPNGHEAWDGVLRLVDVYSVPPEHRPVEQAPSADLLLYTLAVAFGSRAVAVLLSGRGAPGAVGAQAVHAHGGYTLVRGRPVAEALGRAKPAADLPPSPPLTLDAIAPTLLRICTSSRQALRHA